MWQRKAEKCHIRATGARNILAFLFKNDWSKWFSNTLLIMTEKEISWQNIKVLIASRHLSIRKNSSLLGFLSGNCSFITTNWRIQATVAQPLPLSAESSCFCVAPITPHTSWKLTWHCVWVWVCSVHAHCIEIINQSLLANVMLKDAILTEGMLRDYDANKTWCHQIWC